LRDNMLRATPRQPGTGYYLNATPLSREGVESMDLQAPDEESMVRGAVADLDHRFASLDRSRIEATVRRLVHDWFISARIKTFVGIIAERYARSELEPLEVAARGRDA